MADGEAKAVASKTMMDKRDYGYDVIRVIGLWMILVCHILSHFSTAIAASVHDVFAQCGNCVFFVLSGSLLGRKWIAGGCRGYGGGFVWHRLTRVWLTFAVFVLPYVFVLWACGHALSTKQIVFNTMMLSWFAKLPAAGHLWFVTAILMFYVLLVGVSRIGRFVRNHAIAATIASLLLSWGFQCALWMVGVRQAYIIPFLWGASFLFMFVDKLRCNSEMRGLGLLVLLVGIYLLGWGMPREWVQTRCWIALVTAFSVILLTLDVCRGRHVAAWVTWMSGISFEVYLVHCVFIEDVIFPFRAFFKNDFLYALHYFVASFALAYLLQNVVRIIRRFTSRKRQSI